MKITSLKRYVVIAFALVLVGQTFAQTESSLSKRIAEDFCVEFEKNKDKISKDNMEMEMGLIILPLLSKYSEEIKKEWKLDAGVPTDLEKIGEKVGQAAAINCEAFQTFIRNNLKAIVNKKEDEENSKKIIWASGSIQKIEGTPFVSVYLKRVNGKVERLYWMEYFEGADELSSDSKKYSGRQVAFGYREVEVYDPTTKEYKTIKIITNFDDAPPPPVEIIKKN